MSRVRLTQCLLTTAIFAISLSNSASSQNDACRQLDGAVVVTEEGTYLGRISNRYDSDSIFNKYGAYGSKYSGESIWNKYGEFGGRYGQHSPFNPYGNPPLIIKDQAVIAYLSATDSLQGAVNPVLLALVCYNLNEYADFAP